MAAQINKDNPCVTLKLTLARKRKLARIATNKDASMGEVVSAWIDRANVPTRATTGNSESGKVRA